MEGLNVYASPLPFSNKQVKAIAPFGASIQDMVDAQVRRELQSSLGIVVMINGDIALRQYWHVIRPKLGTTININVVPQGGGGKKNPLASLLSIAVLVAAPYLSGAILGAGLAGTVAFGTVTYGTLLSGAIGIVGNMLISALAPPPKPSNLGSISNPAESPTQFIEGAKNSLSPYGVVPICLGTNRMFPLQAARPFTESQNNDQYVRQIFTYGYGEQMVISDLKIGETEISQFSNFEIEHKLEGDLHEGTELYSNDVFQEDMNVLLRQEDGFTERAVQIDSDEAIIDVTFPQGLSEFNTQGKRISRRVQLELQYAPSGTEDWSPGASTYKDLDGAVLSFPEVVIAASYSNPLPIVGGIRIDTIVINKYTGIISAIRGRSGILPSQPIPENSIRIATVTVTTERLSSGLRTTSISMTDIRSSNLFGSTFENSLSFVPSQTGLNQVTVSDGGLLVNDLDILGSQTEALRRSVRIVFPERGDYDIRIRRLSADTESDQIFDKVYLSSVKSVRYEQPINLQGLNGTAIRIKATEQLNGALDQFNVIASNVILDYFEGTGTWEPAITSNPASLYRYVLQGLANARPLADDKIDLDAIQEWHSYCVLKGYTYNRVIDYDTSVEEILRDIASSGAASPAVVDGKRSIVIDGPKADITQIITPRNSWGYSGEMLYPAMPHAFRVQFRNANKGYQQDERIVYNDGYNASNATLFEVLEVQSCTNPQLAWKIGRRILATAKLRPETHTFTMDFENLVSLRGDRIKFEHDVPLIGVGDARIKEVIITGGEDSVTYLGEDVTYLGETVTYDDGGSPLVSGIVFDDTISIPVSGIYYTRIRLSDGTQLYKQINATVGSFTSFTFTTPFTIDDAPQAGDLCYFTQAGGELDLIITRIEPSDDLTAKITCLDYAPAIFNSESGSIPPFVSNITTPLEFIRPVPPVLLNSQADESVLLVNVDGTFTSRAIFTLRNNNEGDISVDVKVRRSGDTAFTNANVLEATPERVMITGLDEGARYDIHIRYKRAGSSVYSIPLQINNFLYVGSSGPPRDVTGFLVNITGENALFRWDANTDVDLQGYRIKYSRVFSGATWGTAQLLEDMVYDNRLTAPFLPGTYLIKAVDLAGNESVNATAIITYDPGQLLNAIEILDQHPDFLGFKDNVVLSGDGITLQDPDNPLGYYYFNETIDLDAVFVSTLSASIRAGAVYFNDFFEIEDIFAEDDVFGMGSGSNDIFDMQDIFEEDDIFGFDLNSWDILLEYRITSDNPSDTSAEWSDWLPLEAESLEFRGIQFRLRMRSFVQNITPKVFELSVTIDMPDRIERGDDLIVPETGATISYDPPFKSNPAVVITIQDGDAADEIEFISKTPSEFSFRVYNRVTTEYVERVYDFISSGYGRENI